MSEGMEMVLGLYLFVGLVHGFVVAGRWVQDVTGVNLLAVLNKLDQVLMIVCGLGLVVVFLLALCGVRL